MQPSVRGRARIAVLNDEHDFLEVVQLYLQRMKGFEVYVRETADNALEYLLEVRPDLIVLDVVFRGQEHGWRILQDVRRDAVLRTTPVILCSAAALVLRELGPEVSRLGLRVLEKPFSLEDLGRAVEAALAERPAPEGR